MEKQEVTREDYEFLWEINSLQHALISSSADPVVLRSVEEGADFDMNYFGGMYFDACEDREKAKETMLERVKSSEKDIREHFRLHKVCLDSLLAMDGAIITNDREEFAENCQNLCESALEYVEVVKTHKDRLREKNFLIYPCCPPGHLFHILNGSYVKNCSFNEFEIYSSAEIGIKKIQEQIIDFKIKSEKLPHIALPLNEQEGAGLLDDNFRGILRINKQLLERVGLNLTFAS